jgi:hypothetical protein
MLRIESICKHTYRWEPPCLASSKLEQYDADNSLQIYTGRSSIWAIIGACPASGIRGTPSLVKILFIVQSFFTDRYSAIDVLC